MTNHRWFIGLQVLFLTASGCASIMDGKTQSVTFNSEPMGAQVVINGMPMGTTPTTITLSRSDYDNANVQFRKEGYETQNAQLHTKLNNWFWGDIICGGLLGSATDGISGAMWEFSPTAYFVSMPPLKASRAEMAKWNYANEVRKFILFTHDRLVSDLAVGEGEHLASLYTMLAVPKEQWNDALVTLKSLFSESGPPASIAEAVLYQFLKS